MKILSHSRLLHGTVGLIFLLPCSPAFAQGMTGMGEMHAAKVRSTSLTLTSGDRTLTLQPADFAAMPHETVNVVNGHTKATESYSGVPIAAMLVKLGLPFEKANEHALLNTYLLAEGMDGYKVLVSAYEAISAVHQGSVLIADTLDGKPLDKDGAFKMVISEDKRPQRWVQNLKIITFKTVE